MNMTRLMGTAALLATTTFAAQSALAYQAGDIYVRGGFEKADPTSDNGDIANQDLDVSEENGFAYGAGYLFHDKFGVELNGSEAMEHDIAVNGGNVGSVDRTPVNLMLNYYPLGGVENAGSSSVGSVCQSNIEAGLLRGRMCATMNHTFHPRRNQAPPSLQACR